MFLHREAGILCHPTSLPGAYGMGEIGAGAFRFVDQLAAAGQSYWQILPINPTGDALVPYSATSSFAGNALLLDFDQLKQMGFLQEDDLREVRGLSTDRIEGARAISSRQAVIDKAVQTFVEAPGVYAAAYAAFRDTHGEKWLNDFAFWEAISRSRARQHWVEWPSELRDRTADGLKRANTDLATSIKRICAEQFFFDRQWAALRDYAHSRGVRLIGDMPIFVAQNSADVWSRPELFKLDAQKRCTVVAGAPPDYFSENGQLWGNPVYRWDLMLEDGFQWWVARVERLLQLVDYVRIDHFRGFAATWETPAGAPTAASGQWAETQGWALFETLKAAFPDMPFIAEDLGHITPDVIELRDAFALPGLKILQFEFGDGPPRGDRDPSMYPHRSVCYPGTHDNNTMLGWLRNDGLDAAQRLHDAAREARAALEFAQTDEAGFVDAINLAALKSGSGLVILQLQDVMGLDGRARMNTPGTVLDANWSWRYREDALTAEMLARLREYTLASGRFADKEVRR